MKQIILALALFASGLGLFAADSTTNSATPQELARQVISNYQNGRMDQRSELPADIPILEKGAKDSPNDPLIYFALGICYIAQENADGTVGNMEKAYTLSHKDVGIGITYAACLKFSKQPLKAYELEKELIESHPGVPQLEIQMATFDIVIQKYDEASTILQDLHQKEPANLPAIDRSALRMMLGTSYLYKGDDAKAIETLEQSLSLVPNMPMSLMVLGEAYLKNGDLERANENLDKILAINPKIPAALYYKGICYEKRGSPEMAAKSFEQAYLFGKQRLQDNGEDYYLMFQICQKLSRNDEGKGYKAEAEKLLFTYEAPWKQTN